MAAFTGTPTASDSYAAARGTTAGPQSTPEWTITHGKWTHTATQGSGTGEVNMVSLPAGKIQVNASLSRVKSTAMAANADLHIGIRAHTKSDGTSFTEDDNYFADNLDAASAIEQTLPLPSDPICTFDTKDGLKIYALIDTGNIEADDTIDLWIAWKRVQ